ncbi:hypothetical protein C7H19_15985 [Aphanothece hegewaldii CCALA 016]|uniref:PEP-CTERM sorting domain-containing protein n=1 Tax=Aphanothece hegewaldii CCALA 016 TaxID=2107694 RepID=A0A2T1LVI7_9CHRO|nr:PEP-CTERM sorting domain-containing protein [Aphanothece hegewaldii]PSF35732.1 hypothetical protein C7H19_15985 [Aphanothece hegewaldii CCALA 016]
MKTLKALASVAIATTIVPLVAGVAEAALIKTVDPLTDFQTVNQATTPNTVGITSQLLGSVNRTISVSGVKSPPSSPFPINAQVDVAGGFLSFATGTGTNGITTINYGTFAATDFTMGGADSIMLGLVSADLAGTNVTVTLNGIPKTLGPFGTVPPPVGPLVFDFDDFAGLDETAVTSFSVTIDPPTAGDVTIDVIGTSGPGIPPTTPEPTTMLGLLAVAAFGSSALKKKQS